VRSGTETQNGVCARYPLIDARSSAAVAVDVDLREPLIAVSGFAGRAINKARR
jgi:hypothetical protein